MRHITVNLKETFPKLPKDIPLQLYLAENDPEFSADFRRPLILVCPGGSYGRTSAREAEPVVFAYLAAGYQVALLHYHCAPDTYPTQLLEVCAAIAYCRLHAVPAQLHIDPNRIYVCGFSAGGHLAASAGVLWKQPVVEETLGVSPRTVRPDAMILCYPVITTDPAFSHPNSINNLLGDRREDPALLSLLALEKQVDTDTPPAFLWTTYDDGLVPCRNTLAMATALEAHGVPFELHIFPHGVHGLSLATRSVYSKEMADSCANPVCAAWMDLSIRWIGDRF